MKIRPAQEKDTDGIWEIFKIVVKSGDTCAFDPDNTKKTFPQYWLATNMRTFVATEADKVIGTYFIKPNQASLGAHIANCGYMVH
jgi:L-amino acid N-acyltransferase YncA